MADLRKIKKEKGSVLVPGANRLRRGVNFAVEVPQGVQRTISLIFFWTEKWIQNPGHTAYTAENDSARIWIQIPIRSAADF